MDVLTECSLFHRQFATFREVVPRKRWMFSQNVRCSHRELDFLTDSSKTDGGTYTEVFRDRKVDAKVIGVLTDEAKEKRTQELFEHLNSTGTEQERSEILFRFWSKLTKLDQSSILETLQESLGSEREQDADDVDELEVDYLDSKTDREMMKMMNDQFLPGLQGEEWRWVCNTTSQAAIHVSSPEYQEDDRLFLYSLIAYMHNYLIGKVWRQGFRKMRAGAKVRLTDWKKFSRELGLEGGRGPVTDFFDEFLQDGEMTKDAWETLQRMWTGEEAVPDCTAQRRHRCISVAVVSDLAFPGDH